RSSWVTNSWRSMALSKGPLYQRFEELVSRRAKTVGDLIERASVSARRVPDSTVVDRFVARRTLLDERASFAGHGIERVDRRSGHLRHKRRIVAVETVAAWPSALSGPALRSGCGWPVSLASTDAEVANAGVAQGLSPDRRSTR